MVPDSQEQLEEGGPGLLAASPVPFTAESPHVSEECPTCGPILESEAYQRGYAQAVEDLKKFHELKDESIFLEIETNI